MNNKEENYTPIHLHTTYGSIGDSIIKIDELIKRAKELNISSLAVTNHGSMTDIYDFYFECKKENIKPLLGCEIYTVEDVTVKDKKNKRCNHLILIAINNTGLKNLLSILAISELEFKYYKPRIDLTNLEKMNTEGLVCTTACVGSHINQLIIQDRILEAKEEVIRLNNIFEYFFLEIQPGDFDEVIKTNKQLIEFHKELNIPLIASNDIHYLYKED